MLLGACIKLEGVRTGTATRSGRRWAVETAREATKRKPGTDGRDQFWRLSSPETTLQLGPSSPSNCVGTWRSWGPRSGLAFRATQVSAPGRAYTCSRNLRVSRSWLGPPLPRTCFHETRRLCGRCSPRRRRWPRRQTRRWRFGGLSRPPLIRPAFVSARASSADFRIVRRMQRRHARDNVYACSRGRCTNP